MPTFLVQRVWEFSPGDVDGSTERRPEDLKDKTGKPIVRVGWWPNGKPLEVWTLQIQTRPLGGPTATGAIQARRFMSTMTSASPASRS